MVMAKLLRLQSMKKFIKIMLKDKLSELTAIDWVLLKISLHKVSYSLSKKNGFYVISGNQDIRLLLITPISSIKFNSKAREKM
ncbi:hypothetical protein D3C74_457590 [compost metagenome]